MLKKTRADRANYGKDARDFEARITELEALVNTMEEFNREKDGLNAIIKDEMTSQKRNAFLATSRLKAM